MNVPPTWFLEKMSEADRRKHFPGVAGMTAAEARAVPIAKAENELQRQLDQMLRRHGIEPTRQRMDRKSNIAAAMPDMSFSVHGRAVYWEVKMPGKRPTDEQTAMIATLQAPPNSAIVSVVTSYVQGYEEFMKLFRPTVDKTCGAHTLGQSEA